MNGQIKGKSIAQCCDNYAEATFCRQTRWSRHAVSAVLALFLNRFFASTRFRCFHWPAKSRQTNAKSRFRVFASKSSVLVFFNIFINISGFPLLLVFLLIIFQYDIIIIIIIIIISITQNMEPAWLHTRAIFLVCTKIFVRVTNQLEMLLSFYKSHLCRNIVAC